MLEQPALSRYTPSMLNHETLEAMLVQRQALAKRLVDLIEESVLTGNKHYLLLYGPRGIGKTHMVSLVYHRVKLLPGLSERLAIAWLREEEWGVASYLDLLCRILRALHEEYSDSQLAEACAQLRTRSPEQAEHDAEILLRTWVGERTLLIISENFDEIFRGIEEEGQLKLRAYIQNYPMFTILATAQSLFNGISVRESPFYGFFEHHQLPEITLEDAISLLANIAALQQNDDLASFIRTAKGRGRIRAVHHLAGGNPRVYVIFSQFLTCESLDALVEPVMKTLDDLTPYYQARMAYLSPQQRKIAEFLCERRGAVSVGEIARENFISHQTTSGQLKKMLDLGYVRVDTRGRESYYELREPLMRICLDVKRLRGEPIRLIVEFLRVWYSQTELSHWFKALPLEDQTQREYLLRALDLNRYGSENPVIAACFADYKMHVSHNEIKQALQVADEIIEQRGVSSDWRRRAECLKRLGQEEESKEAERHVLTIQPSCATDWIYRGQALTSLEQETEALDCFDRAITIDPRDCDAWLQRGNLLHHLGRNDEALSSFDKALNLEPSSALTWVLRAGPLGELRRDEEALASCKKAIEIEPSDAFAWTSYGYHLERSSRLEDAIYAYDKAVEIDSYYAHAWTCRAILLEQLDRHAEALESHDRAVYADPANAYAWVTRGAFLEQIERYDDALASFDKAVKLRPTDSYAWTRRGAFLERSNRYEDALDSYDRAISANPKYSYAWTQKASLSYRLGRYSMALESIDKSIEIERAEPENWTSRGYCLGVLGHYREAISSFDRAIELDQDEVGAWVGSAGYSYEMGELEKALISIQKARDLGSTVCGTLFIQAAVLSSLGRQPEALELLKEVLKSPSDSEMNFHASLSHSVILMISGRWREGQSVLDEALCKRGQVDLANAIVIARSMLIRTQDKTTWQQFIKTWVSTFKDRQALTILGQGLLSSVRTLAIRWLGEDTARAWGRVWQEEAGVHPEMEMPLRLLDAAIEYRWSTPPLDDRVLLRLPSEERSLLESLLVPIVDCVSEMDK